MASNLSGHYSGKNEVILRLEFINAKHSKARGDRARVSQLSLLWFLSWHVCARIGGLFLPLPDQQPFPHTFLFTSRVVR